MPRKRTGSVRKLGNKYYAYVAREFLGSFDFEEDAREMIAAALIDHAEKSPTTFGDLFKVYMDEVENDARRRGRARVFDRERSLARRHIATAKFWHYPVRAVTPKIIQQHIGATLKKQRMKALRDGQKSMRLEPTDKLVTRRTAQRMLSRLKLFFDAMIIDGQVEPPNPARLCKLPPAQVSQSDGELIVHLTADEIRALFKQRLSPIERAAFAVAIYAGLRVGELLGLRWQDVVRLDGGRPQLQIRKSYDGPAKTERARRDVPLLPPAVQALRAYRDTFESVPITGLVFAGHEGQPFAQGHVFGWTDRSYSKPGGGVRIVRGWRHRAGIREEVQFRHLRHTCGSHLLQGTFGVKLELISVSKWLGHSTLAVTERHYATLSRDSLHDAIERQNGGRGGR